jgi:hypothetical protein
MSSSNVEPDETVESPAPADQEPTIGNLTVEDDPEGTVDPSDLAGTASEDDEDVS